MGRPITSFAMFNETLSPATRKVCKARWISAFIAFNWKAIQRNVLAKPAKDTDRSRNALSSHVNSDLYQKACVSRFVMSPGPCNDPEPFIAARDLWDDVSALKDSQWSSQRALVKRDKGYLPAGR